MAGLFTDSDLARLFEDRRESALDSPIQYVMTSQPATIQQRAPLTDAVQLLLDLKISELPVVDADHRPLGLIDITDVMPLLPTSEDDASAAPDPLIVRFPDSAQDTDSVPQANHRQPPQQ